MAYFDDCLEALDHLRGEGAVCNMQIRGVIDGKRRNSLSFVRSLREALGFKWDAGIKRTKVWGVQRFWAKDPATSVE